MRNVEGAVVGYLKALPALAGVAIGTRVPNPRPTKHVRVQRVSGQQLNLIRERPTLLVECWGGTDVEAWLLTVTCHEALVGRELVAHNGIELDDRDVSSPVNYPDPSTTSPRYTFTLTTTVDL